MSLSWPWALAALLVLPLIFALQWWWRRRRRRAAVRVTSIALVRTALPGRTRWQRRIPAALLAAGLVALGVGAARPQATVPVPLTSATILLALDVSGSMCSTDVDPNRITAAREAAKEFIESQRGGPRIGLVTFAGTAGLLVPPTGDTDELLKALDGLVTYRGTAIGQAILASLDALAEVDPSIPPTGADPGETGQEGRASAAIVVLTDGRNTRGVDPMTAAEQAALRRVRVFTIGFGTTTPAPAVCDSSQIDGGFGGFGGRGGFDSGRGGGWRSRGVIDEAALKEVAATTGGTYSRAEDADQLHDVLADLPATFSVVHEQRDLSAWFAVLGGLLAGLATALSLWWNRARRT